jgi:NitT/TauT family transport system ATP-binding protein
LILQDYGLLPWATVWDNAALGLQIRSFYGPDGVHTPSDEKLDEASASGRPLPEPWFCGPTCC